MIVFIYQNVAMMNNIIYYTYFEQVMLNRQNLMKAEL